MRANDVTHEGPSKGLNVQDMLRQWEAGELPNGTPPLVPDGEYTLTVTNAEAGSDHIYVFMETEGGEKTRIRFHFASEVGRSVAFERLNGFGVSNDEIRGCAALADIAALLPRRVVAAKLGHWTGDGRTFQTLLPGLKLVRAVE